MKPYYSDYAKHMMRFYARTAHDQDTLHPVVHKFKSDIDKKNWEVCQRVLDKLSDTKVETLLHVYSGNETMSEAVGEASEHFDIPLEEIWNLISKTERDIAKRRGLV